MKQRPLVVALTAALVALTPGVASARGDHDAAPHPGAAGIGDPYYPLDGNGGYDVRHYDLHLRYNPATNVLRGVATITARATQALSRFDLDLIGLHVRSISVDHERARWSRAGQELRIRPAEPIDDHETFTVRIRYAGVPRTVHDELGTSGFMHTDDGAIVAGQPEGASTWFPANDHPRDAASVSLDITVPTGLQAMSNGVLERRETSRRWTTWSWRAAEPMAPYLVTLAIGKFDVRTYRADGTRFWDALDPDLFELDLDPDKPDNPSAGEVAEDAFARQPEIIDFLEGFFGRYPFRASGGIVDDHPPFEFALETQTRPMYAGVFFSDRIDGETVVVHELAHQWVGDLLRLRDWKHIWLNEGFATYTEWLWLEREGIATPAEMFRDLAVNAPPEFWRTTIGDPGARVDRLFADPEYFRGAMTLQALRQKVGDRTFFAILRRWVSSQAGSTVTSREFIDLAEQVSGRQLDRFFRIWLFTPRKPAGLPDTAPAPAGPTAASSAVDRASSHR